MLYVLILIGLVVYLWLDLRKHKFIGSKWKQYYEERDKDAAKHWDLYIEACTKKECE